MVIVIRDPHNLRSHHSTGSPTLDLTILPFFCIANATTILAASPSPVKSELRHSTVASSSDLAILALGTSKHAAANTPQDRFAMRAMPCPDWSTSTPTGGIESSEGEEAGVLVCIASIVRATTVFLFTTAPSATLSFAPMFVTTYPNRLSLPSSLPPNSLLFLSLSSYPNKIAGLARLESFFITSAHALPPDEWNTGRGAERTAVRRFWCVSQCRCRSGG